MMPVVYIAGPFRGPDHWVVAENIRRAERLALDVWRAGCAAICPHLNTAHYQGVLSPVTFLEGDLEILKRCDAVVLTSDWQKSMGARNERQIAWDNGIPIFYEDYFETFLAWVDKQKKKEAKC